MSAPAPAPGPSRGDRAGLWAFVGAGAAITVATAVFAIMRIVELLGPDPAPVEVRFAGLPIEVPAGSGALPAELEAATIRVTDMPVASLAAGVAAPVITALVTAAVSACLIALAISVLRGTIFSRRNTRLVSVAGIVGLVGYAASELCRTMLANGALAWATDRQVDNIVFGVAPAPYILAAFVIALVSTVFVVGERLQRETEGLV
ncbi:hypothetical protein H490_0101195 [Leucobacter sp. UCD-THU]|uniref:DUF2975 domain-containing protein n=1 Tax=Leucobacter sp. UCD-THU TaxID=1292023 RepID=UPI00036EA499|nr:DUF2975 domain-containing protein [Leucobacter sp. UCD-THU]EYT56515.1 hypothetical protein H490_0101195 [Leucobacter sp. UCD-THU]